MVAWADSATHVIAVDGGFHNIESVGKLPHVIVGDFDSANLNDVPESVQQDFLPDQDQTDFQKVLQWCFERGYSSVHVICAEGDLPDHQLQNLYAAASALVDVWFVFERGMGRIVRADHGMTQLSASVGARVSLIPLAACESVNLSGVQWPLQNESLVPLGSSSISNRAVQEQISVGMGQGVALLFWETNEIIWKES